MRLRRMAVYAWAFPPTLLGLLPLPLVLLQGGFICRIDGVWEISGGFVSWFLQHGIRWMGPVQAMTFGHVVWGLSEDCLRRTRAHERVHVRQYERWGPFFIPAYLCASAWAKFRGRDPYRDNPFEREAFAMDE